MRIQLKNLRGSWVRVGTDTESPVLCPQASLKLLEVHNINKDEEMQIFHNCK